MTVDNRCNPGHVTIEEVSLNGRMLNCWMWLSVHVVYQEYTCVTCRDSVWHRFSKIIHDDFNHIFLSYNFPQVCNIFITIIYTALGIERIKLNWTELGVCLYAHNGFMIITLLVQICDRNFVTKVIPGNTFAVLRGSESSGKNKCNNKKKKVFCKWTRTMWKKIP